MNVAVNILRERTIMRLANNLLFYWHELFACRAALCRPRHPPWALSSSQRKQGVWPGGSAVVGMSSLHATATSYSIRHFWVRAWRRCANQERRPARPDLLEGGKGLVPLRVALSPLHLPAEKLAESVNLISSAPASRFGAERGSA